MAKSARLLLEGIQAWKVQNLGEFVEGVGAGFGQGWVQEVGLGDFIWIGAVDQIGELDIEVVGHDDALVDSGKFGVGEWDAEAETGGASAVAHGFADIEVVDGVDGVGGIGDHFVDEFFDAWIFGGFEGGDQGHGRGC